MYRKQQSLKYAGKTLKIYLGSTLSDTVGPDVFLSELATAINSGQFSQLLAQHQLDYPENAKDIYLIVTYDHLHGATGYHAFLAYADSYVRFGATIKGDLFGVYKYFDEAITIVKEGGNHTELRGGFDLARVENSAIYFLLAEEHHV